MKTRIYKYFVISIFLFSCEQEFIERERDPGYTPPPAIETPSAGGLDFSTFVAIGNSLTAGYQAGALFTEGQNNSVPAIMAEQFAVVGGGDFNQPDINSENGYSGMAPDGTVFGRLRLQGNPPVPTPQLSDASAIPNIAVNPSFAYSGDKSALNNFAVPGIQVGQILTPATGDWGNATNPAFNPYYARFASSPGASTILNDALARNPTFFFFWLGANDVLGYAVGGASNEAIFTSVANFTTYYTAALTALTANGAKGVVGTIPYVTSIPFFKLVPWNSIALDATTAAALNANPNFQGLNFAVAAGNNAGLISDAEMALRNLTWAEGGNGVLMYDEDLFDLRNLDPSIPEAYAQVRLANATDLLPLTTATVLGVNLVAGDDATKQGVVYPVQDKHVLTETEQDLILARTDAFNNDVIRVVVNNINSSTVKVAIFDAQARLAGLNTVPTYLDNVMVDATLAPPFGAFSEDGVHPNSRGYALTARWIIETINSTFGSKVPRPRISDYPGTGLPLN